MTPVVVGNREAVRADLLPVSRGSARSTRSRWSLAATTLVFALALGACGSAEGSDLSLTLATVDGTGEIELGAPSATPRVVNLWATWCPPCRAELPDFDEVAAAGAGAVEVIGVNVGEEADAAQELVDELELEFTQLLDPDSELSAQLEVVNMPSTAFLAADGSVVEVRPGALTAASLVEAIDENLGVEVSLPG